MEVCIKIIMERINEAQIFKKRYHFFVIMFLRDFKFWALIMYI